MWDLRRYWLIVLLCAKAVIWDSSTEACLGEGTLTRVYAEHGVCAPVVLLLLCSLFPSFSSPDLSWISNT